MRKRSVKKAVAVLTAFLLLFSATACSGNAPAERQPVLWADWSAECVLRNAKSGASARMFFTDKDNKNLFSFRTALQGSASVTLSVETWRSGKWKEEDSAAFSCEGLATDRIELSAFYYSAENALTLLLRCGGKEIGSMPADSIRPKTAAKAAFCSVETEGRIVTEHFSVSEATREPNAMELLLSENSRNSDGFYFKLAKQATDDLICNFWDGDAQTGRIVTTMNGFPVEAGGDERGSVWETSFIITALYDMYLLTGDAYYRQILEREADFYKNSISYEEWANASGNFNWASDDCAWNCLLLLALYDVTGDEALVQNVIGLTDSVLARWYDEELNGIRYKDDVDFMSLYEVGLTFTWLRLWEITAEQRFYDLALRSYEGMHARLGAGRDDGLYFCEANEQAPRGEVDNINEAGSSSFLAGNLGMAALAARFFRLTGDEAYLSRVYRINEGLLNKYVRDGILLNDRDAWTNGAFTAFYVSEVLSLPDTEQMQQVIYDTAYSIAANARTYDGHYGGSWQGPAAGSGSVWHRTGSTAYQSNTSGTSVLMITAAALLEAGITDYRR